VNALGHVRATLSNSRDVGTVAWQPAGDKIIAADQRNQSLDLWDLSSRKKVWHINKYGLITADSIGFSGDGENIAVTSVAAIAAPNRDSESALTVLSSRDGHILRDVVDIKPQGGFSNFARHFSFTADKKECAVILADSGVIAIFDVSNWSLLQRVGPLTNAHGWHTGVDQVAVDRNRDLVVAGFVDGDVQVLSISENKVVTSFHTNSDLRALAYDAISGTVISGATGNETGRLTRTPSGEERLTVSRDDAKSLVRGWDVNTGAPTRTYSGPNGGVKSLAVSPDGRRLAATKGVGHVVIWHLQTGELLAEIDYGRSSARGLAFSLTYSSA